MLRSMALSPTLDSGLRDKARDAMNRIDRAPISDDGLVAPQPSLASDADADAPDTDNDALDDEEGEVGP